MPPLQSLKRRQDFLTAAANRRKYVAHGFILQMGKCDTARDGCRLGFTVSKKVGNAVERNRVKRRLRAACRDIMQEKAHPGCDYVLIGRRNALTCSFDRLTRDLAQGLLRLNKGQAS